MAQFPGITLTNAGLNMIAESQASSTSLIFTNLKMGDGTITAGEDIKALTAVKHQMLTAPITSRENKGNGQIKLRFAISNAELTTGFFTRELGIYAKLGESGAELLYAYTNAGNLTDYIPDKETPIDEEIIDIYLVVGNAYGVSVVTDSSIMFVTTADLAEHNKDTTAHEDIREALKKASALPLGTIMPFLMKSAPAGWLALDTGALVSRTTYAELWAWVQANAPLISETDWQTQAASQSSVGAYSTGDGSTTFRLPKIVDYVRGGAVTDVGKWQGDDFKSHKHVFSKDGDAPGGTVPELYSVAATAAQPRNGGYTTAVGGDETRPKTIKFLYCVKAFDAATNQGLIDITALANEKAETNMSNINSIGKSTISRMGMPSDTFVAFSPVQAQNYTAPANGYFTIRSKSTDALNDCELIRNSGNNIWGINTICRVHAAGLIQAVTLPAKKGDVVQLAILNTTVEYFRFYYAEGEI